MPSNSSHERAIRLASHIFIVGRHVRKGEKGKTTDPATLLRFRTLGYIKERHTPLMKDIARYLCITPPSATSLINGLVGAKLIERHLDERDRRHIRLSITPKGEKLLERGFKKLVKRMEHLISVLTPQEQKLLVRILEKIALRHEK